jgi:ribose 1,5-bisphosphokinase
MAGGSSDGQGKTLIGPGRVIIIVGPSGAGKDTLIGMAKAELAGRDDVVFPRRLVTRDADGSEDSLPLAVADFEAGHALGGFSLSWAAHGHGYAYPLAIDDDIAQGRTVVLNTSRMVVAAARGRYRQTHVVLIDAAPELRRARLLGRGREEGGVVALRLERETAFQAADADTTIRNDGDPREAAARLIAVIAGD